MALKVAFVLGLFLLAIADVTHGLAAGGTGTSIKLRGRKWNYSPITNADYSNGDFIHIQGGCLDDAALLQPSANFSIEFWFRLDPEEMWNPVNVPHTFSMAQEYNFWVMYTIQISPGVYVWAGNWVSPCGWLATKSDTTSPFVNSGYIFLPTNTWIHFAVVNDNYGVTAYINGIAVASLFCPLPFDAAPVWTIGIRDWSTDVAKKNQLSPIFPMTGEIAEFRAWRRPISAAEVLNRMNRALLPSEIMDPSLTLYFDFNNITDGYILNDMSATKRLTGKMGGALGLEINIPKLVTSTAPVVNTSTSLVKVTMKESGDYSSRVPIPLFTVDARTASFDLLSSTSKVNYTITSLPDPSILTLSTSTTGETFNALSGTVPVALGSSFNLYVTHRANLSVTSWPAQTFSVTVALGGLIVNVPVIVTILKNAAPTIGDNGGAIVPPDTPASVTQRPIVIPKFAWRNGTYNVPITLEFWTVGTEDDRSIDLTEFSSQRLGRFNAEVNKNLVVDYGWEFDGSGRTSVSFRRKFGIWTHVAMVSTGMGGTQTMYINGVAVSQARGNIALKSFDLPPSNLTGFLETAMTGTVVMDEFRVWNAPRTQQQLRDGMFNRLTGNETGLYMYHNFDSYTINPDGTYLFRDLGPYGFDLICQGHTVTTKCPYSRSSVPIGGIIEYIMFNDGANVSHWDPLGNDLDDDTAYLRFVVTTLPTDAKLMAEKNQTLRALDGDLRFSVGHSNPQYVSPVSVGSYIRKMQLIPSVMIVPSADGGGNPYDSFSYLVTDGLRNSRTATIQISRNCWPGTYLNQTQRKCLPCAPGFYSTTFSYSSSCTPCPAGTSQSRAGSSQCVPCERAIFLSLTNATNTNSTSLNLPSTIVGIDDVASFGTFQDTAGQATCMSCMMLQYAIRVNSTSCEGRAFIPKYVTLGGSAQAYPSVSGMLLGGSAFIAGIGNSNGTLVRSVLDASSRSSDVVSAIDQARIMNAPRAVVVTGCLIAIITFLGLIGTFLFSNDPVIKASSPIALTITAVGIIMGALSVITYSVEPSKASCVAEVWLLPISFSVVIGMLISKTFRILRIFNNPRALKIRMTNVDLFGYMVAATSANVAILIIWTIYDPPVPVVVSRGSSDGLNFIYCGSKNSAVQSGFTAVLYLYNAGLLVILSILAFLTRSVNALFSESKFIGYFVAATVFSVSLFIPILYFLTNEISGIYIIKSVAILIITSSAFATLIGIKFYSIFRNRQQQASGVPTSPNKTMLGGTTAVDKNGKVGINSLYMQLLQTSPTTMVANTVFPTKKVGVVFWNAKVAILQPELRMLFILSPDVAASAKAPAPIPEMIVLPLTKFTVSSPESSSNSTNKNFVSTMGTSSVMDSSASSGSSNPSQNDTAVGAATTSPILTVTNNESGHVVTLQFESSQIKREWMMVLNQLAEGKHVRVEHEKKAVVATGKGDA